jgi:hypothetical protein
MFGQGFCIRDLERLGPIVERLLRSGKLTDDEKWAVDQSFRAATDLAHIRHSEIAKAFYARPDIEARCVNSIAEWLVNNNDAKPGTVTVICGRMHVASYDRQGNLGLYPVLEL